MVEGVNSSMIPLIYWKNFCKCHNVPPPRITIKKGKMEWPIDELEVFWENVTSFFITFVSFN
jgi:hypothetical protein